MGLLPLTVVSVDRLPDYLLSLGLEILAAAPSTTDTELAGTAFMAAYLSPSQPGFGALNNASLFGSSSLLARMMGSISKILAQASAPPPVSPFGGRGVKRVPRGVQGGPPLLGYGGPVDPGGLSPPCHSGSSLAVFGALFLHFQPPSKFRLSAYPAHFTRNLFFFVGGPDLLPSWLLQSPALLCLVGQIQTRMCP
jgi:hypothetical protein